MSLEKNLERALNSGKIRIACERQQHEGQSIVVLSVTRNNKPLFAAATNEEGAQALLAELESEG